MGGADRDSMEQRPAGKADLASGHQRLEAQGAAGLRNPVTRPVILQRSLQRAAVPPQAVPTWRRGGCRGSDSASSRMRTAW